MTETPRPDASEIFARHIVGCRFEDLSPEDVLATKRLVLDTLATLVGGSGEPPFPELLRFYREEGGAPEATVMVHGLKLPARHAVALNSGMARALDLDDAHEAAIVHTGVHVVPAALAIAERSGSISGRELITAIALGQDLMARLSLACASPPILRGRPGTYVFGTFATAAVTARLLRLDVRGVLDALGNAYTRSAGTTLGYHDGALAQRVLQGLSASDGVLAGLLAARGIGGIRGSLEGDAGYFTVHEGGRYDRDVLLGGLGSTFHGTTTALKRYPVHRGAILDIEVACRIARRPSFVVEDVRRIVVRYPARFREGHERIGAFRPERASPRGPVEPHFSNPWAVGVALCNGGIVRIEDFSEAGVDGLRDRVAPIARRVEGVADEALDEVCRGLGPRVIEVILRDGTVLVERLDHASGGPERPLRWSDLMDKLEDCARLAALPLAPRATAKALAAIQDLESCDDVSWLPGLLVGVDPSAGSGGA
ncbi:MAG: MmgE/PrpD family protein [Myxococcota bacterium]